MVSAVSGVKRSVGEVKKKWAVLKSSAKVKAAANARQRGITGGRPSTQVKLSATDGRIVGMLSSVAVSGKAERQPLQPIQGQGATVPIGLLSLSATVVKTC